MHAKFNRIFPIVYIIILIAGIFYVRSVVNSDSFTAKPKPRKESGVTVRKLSVYLTIEMPGKPPVTFKNEELRNIDTPIDLLESFRKDKKLTYERTAYTFGNVFENINGMEPPEHSSWQIFLTRTNDDGENIINEDITNKMERRYLEHNDRFTLKIVQSR